MDYMLGDYESGSKVLQKTYPELSDEVLYGMQHYLGFSNTGVYLKAYKETLKKTGDEDKAHNYAEIALKDSIEKQTKKKAPKNTKVKN